MPLLAGLAGTEYQQVLRAIGRLMDTEGFRNFRIIEQEEGLILQVTRGGFHARTFETYLLTGEDIQALLVDAYQRRGSGSTPVPPAEASS